MTSRSVVYYITAHGYGHGVRSCDIIRALQARLPGVPIVVVSGLPESFLRSRIPWRDVTLRQASFDVGLVQKDGIRSDMAATVRALKNLLERHDSDLLTEAGFLGSSGAGVVVADIPWLPLAAARRSGIPAVAVGNFSWDWIYEPFAERDREWREIVKAIGRDYVCADGLIQLPFAGFTPVFRSVEAVPLVASPGVNRRAELSAALGVPVHSRWYLLAFASLDWEPGALERLGRLSDASFLAMEPAAWAGSNIFTVRRSLCSFADLVASVDGVVSKPGYGVVSDCVVNRKPLVYAEREDFREYPVLVDAIRRYLRSAHIPQERLYRGDLGEALAAVESAPEPTEVMASGGAPVAAALIAARMAG